MKAPSIFRQVHKKVQHQILIVACVCSVLPRSIPELAGSSVSNVLVPYEQQLNSTARSLRGVVTSGRSALASLNREGVRVGVHANCLSALGRAGTQELRWAGSIQLSLQTP